MSVTDVYEIITKLRAAKFNFSARGYFRLAQIHINGACLAVKRIDG